MVALLIGQYWFRAGYWENRSWYDWLSFSSPILKPLSLFSCRADWDWDTSVSWTTVVSNTHTTHAAQCQKIAYTMSHHPLPWIRDNKAVSDRKQSRLTEVKKGWFKKNRVNPLCKPSRNRIYSKIRRRDRQIYFSTKWQKTRPAFCWNTRIMVKFSCSTSICTLYTNAVLSKGRLAVEENVFLYFCPFRHLNFTQIRQWHKIWDAW